MKVLDATFLVDYLDGVDATAEYLLAHEDERFILPAPAYAEALVGEGNDPNGDVAEAKAELSWGAVYETGEDTASLAGEIADEIGPQGPFLAGTNGLIAAVGRELDTPVVSDDGDLTHEETKKVVDVEEY
ncbi:VapC toxin family PIN domain ribonuclease [Halobacteriales archaeon QS_8_69_26]|nr:MAG: VapC toxin family PIN domain ribonuclease [Halobacteriales archaeon QS_8_69_26]